MHLIMKAGKKLVLICEKHLSCMQCILQQKEASFPFISIVKSCSVMGAQKVVLEGVPAPCVHSQVKMWR